MAVRIEMAGEDTRAAVYEDTATIHYRFAFGVGGVVIVFSAPPGNLEERTLESAWSPARWSQAKGDMLDARARRELNL